MERTFSAQGDVHSDRRNRLADVIVESEMFIEFNERTVRRLEEWERGIKETKSRDASGRRLLLLCVVGKCARRMMRMRTSHVVAGLFRRPERRDPQSDVLEEKEGEAVATHPLPAVAVVSRPSSTCW